MGTLRKRSSRYPPHIQRRVRHLAREGWGPYDIERILASDEAIQDSDVPTTKTIRKWRDEDLTRGPDEPWVLSGSPEDAPLILPSLVELLRRTEGRVPHLTKSEAEWVLKLRQAQPQMPAWDALKVARRYIDAAHQSERLLELDRYVALRLWLGGELVAKAMELGIVSRDLIDRIDDGGAFGDPVYRLKGAIVEREDQ